ncbi:MAG: hypothetical protein GY827_04695 [Cytophagales bacterium]|nr:hypothetical protein [Cytophagales bacterium]
MNNAITTVNNIKFNKRQIISEIKSRRSCNFHEAEPVRNQNNRVVAQRFHFAGPQKDALEIQEFFDHEVIQKDEYTYYMEFQTRPNFR